MCSLIVPIPFAGEIHQYKCGDPYQVYYPKRVSKSIGLPYQWRGRRSEREPFDQNENNIEHPQQTEMRDEVEIGNITIHTAHFSKPVPDLFCNGKKQ